MKTIKKSISPFSVAPMMGRTTRHYRYFFRLICKEVTLYTEMQTTGAILNAKNPDSLLAFDRNELNLALQLGGGNPSDLAAAVRRVENYNFMEINLNIGCPSSRVQSGCFGAVLFKDSARVMKCIAAMSRATQRPITVKIRIGVDEYYSYDYLSHFVKQLSHVGCETFIIHARRGWLSGLSPKENREIPPLNYEWVYQIKRDYPQLNVVLNGGVNNLMAAKEHLRYVDSVMIGRAAWTNPYLFAEVDGMLLKNRTIPSREAVLTQYLSYLSEALKLGEHSTHLIQPLFGLFYSVPGAKQWRTALMELSNQLRNHKLGDPFFERLKALARSISEVIKYNEPNVTNGINEGC